MYQVQCTNLEQIDGERTLIDVRPDVEQHIRFGYTVLHNVIAGRMPRGAVARMAREIIHLHHGRGMIGTVTLAVLRPTIEQYPVGGTV